MIRFIVSDPKIDNFDPSVKVTLAKDVDGVENKMGIPVI